MLFIELNELERRTGPVPAKQDVHSSRLEQGGSDWAERCVWRQCAAIHAFQPSPKAHKSRHDASALRVLFERTRHGDAKSHAMQTRYTYYNVDISGAVHGGAILAGACKEHFSAMRVCVLKVDVR